MLPANRVKTRWLAMSIAITAALGTAASTVACAPVTVAASQTSEENHVHDAAIVVSDMRVQAKTGGAADTVATPGSAEVPVRVYGPASPWATLVWAHGGSFIRGTLDWPEADWVARRFAESGVRVISVDYVLASDEVKAPAPSNDVAAVVAWAGTEYAGPLVVGGASAGAHLAVLATLDHAGGANEQGPSDEIELVASASDDRRVSALLLQYPTLHRVQRADAALAAAVTELPEARRFDAARIAEMYEFYLGNSGAPVAGELPPERLAELPPVVIMNADADELRASGEEFAEQLREAGVPVADAIQPGTVHGYMNRPEESDRARADAHATIEFFNGELRRILGV